MSDGVLTLGYGNRKAVGRALEKRELGSGTPRPTNTGQEVRRPVVLRLHGASRSELHGRGERSPPGDRYEVSVQEDGETYAANEDRRRQRVHPVVDYAR